MEVRSGLCTVLNHCMHFRTGVWQRSSLQRVEQTCAAGEASGPGEAGAPCRASEASASCVAGAACGPGHACSGMVAKLSLAIS